jgi:hypothetical protein
MNRHGRTLFVNAYVEDSDGLILTIYNHRRNFWSLPGCEVRAAETPELACARTLLNECSAGVNKILPLYEDEAGSDGYVIALQAAIDCMPRSTRQEAPICAMTHEEYLSQTDFPIFYSRLFAVARRLKLYCIAIERFRLATKQWGIETHYVHGISQDDARQKFLTGEKLAIQEGRIHIVDCGLVIGYKVIDDEGSKLVV